MLRLKLTDSIHSESYFFLGSGSCPAVIRQTIPSLSTSSRYTLSFYLYPRTASSDAQCSFITYLGGKPVETFPLTSYTRNKSYVKHQITGIVPGSDSQDLILALACTSGNGVYVEYDDISLQQESYS